MTYLLGAGSARLFHVTLKALAQSLLAIVLLLGLGAQVTATEVRYCPKKIAYIDGNPFANFLLPEVKSIYRSLGCPTRFIALPGRRGVANFNTLAMDGELMRFRLMEGEYKRDFIRSPQPLATLEGRFYWDPSYMAKRDSIGYVLGLKWHEEEVSKNPGKSYVAFKTNMELYEAYNRHLIVGFYCARHSFERMRKQGVISRDPAHSEVVHTNSLYHYLGGEYADFMVDFAAKYDESKISGQMVSSD
ncbi:MAG: hypothetical protein R3261_09420 [Alphaproteobacteria bacterium]|nr:hypothetical protein [Alphaproteobacteria bacterium]